MSTKILCCPSPQVLQSIRFSSCRKWVCEFQSFTKSTWYQWWWEWPRQSHAYKVPTSTRRRKPWHEQPQTRPPCRHPTLQQGHDATTGEFRHLFWVCLCGNGLFCPRAQGESVSPAYQTVQE